MPEATVLYTVTAMVVTGLVLWVGVVLRSAKEPWARPAPHAVDLEPLPPAAGEPSTSLATDPSPAPASEAAPAPSPPPANPIDADETARATPVALSEGRLKALEAEDAAAAQAEQAAKKS